MVKVYRAIKIEPNEEQGGLVFNDGEHTGIILWGGFKEALDVKLPEGISNSALLGYWDEKTPSKEEILKTAKYNRAQIYFMSVGERTRVEFYRVDFSRAIYKIPNILDAKVSAENIELTDDELDRQFELETLQVTDEEIEKAKNFLQREEIPSLNIPKKVEKQDGEIRVRIYFKGQDEKLISLNGVRGKRPKLENLRLVSSTSIKDHSKRGYHEKTILEVRDIARGLEALIAIRDSERKEWRFYTHKGKKTI